jgi:hypothetical protein
MYRGSYDLKSLEEAASQQKEMGLDLARLKEVAWWFLFLMLMLFMNLFYLLKVVTRERKKKSAGNSL